MKKIAVILLLSLIITGCSAVTIPTDNTGVLNEDTVVEQVETAVEVKEPEAPKPEKTPEELAEIERIRKEKDAELKIKLEKANEERLARMEADKDNRLKREVIKAIDEHGLWDVANEDMTLEEVLALIPTPEEVAEMQKEYQEKEELRRKQTREIHEAKVLNKPHVLKPDIEREILEVTNRYRAEAGIHPLKWNDRIHSYARSYNLYMFTYSIWEHNIVYPTAENLYMSGTKDPETHDAEFIVADWMNSPGHKKNLLNPEAYYMGAAVLTGVTKHPVTGEVKPVLFATQQFYDTDLD